METEPPSSRSRPHRAPTPRRDAPAPVAVLEVAARTEKGDVRTNNEDTPFVGPRLGVIGVCDGMGGANGGEVASAIAAGVLVRRLDPWAGLPGPRDTREVARAVELAIEEASRAVHRMALDRPELSGMGTTATLAVPCGAGALVGHVGDSRLYLYRAPRLVRVTRDQTLVQRLVDTGRITEEEAEQSNLRHVVLQAVGTGPDLEPDLSYLRLDEGDVLVVCSDGVSGALSEEGMREILASRSSPRAACDALVEAALEAGSQDNATCVVARVTLRTSR